MFIIAFLLLQIPAPVPTGDEMAWVLESAKWAVEQFQNKNYMPAVGMTIMLLVFVFNKFFHAKVKKEHLALVSASIGVLSAVAMNMMALAVGSQPMEWVSAIMAGLTMGAAASGFWSLIGKMVVDKVSGKIK